MGVIYLRTNLVNGMQYVGKSKKFKSREYQWRCLEWTYANSLLTEERKKYGLENFKVEILEECDDSELDELERMYIEKYNTLYPNGYNDNEGGSLGFHHSEKTKKKIGDAGKGKHFDRKGIPLTNEHKENIAKALKGKIPVKAIEAHKNKTSKKVYQCSINNELIAVYDSIRDATRKTNFEFNGIRCCCNGGFYSKYRKKWVNCYSFKGFKWMYKEDYEKMLAEQSC